MAVHALVGGVLAARYPAAWGVGQLVTGALSDRWDRKPFVVGGLLVQSGALALVAAANGFSCGPWPRSCWAPGPRWPTPPCSPRSATWPNRPGGRGPWGIYRLWRDGGFAMGALLAGALADLFSIRAAVRVVAGLTAASGVLSAVRMHETHRQPQR